jgi:uncharacterized protein (TIGR03067 family)
MSPEQADGKPIDHRSDLFSLGSVLYAMCTGRSPFRANSTVATLKRVCEATPRPIRELNPEMPEWLCDIIAKLLAKNPADRFSSAGEVAELLERHLAQAQSPTAQHRLTTMEQRTLTRPPRGLLPKLHPRWTLVGAIVILVFGAGWLSLRHFESVAIAQAKLEREALNGRWVFVSAVYKGRPVPPAETKDKYPSEMILKGDQYGIAWAGKLGAGELLVNTRKRPAEIDFSMPVFEGMKPRKAIYELSGDRLTLCMAYLGPKADPPRPTSFETDEQSQNVVLVYRREDLPPPSKKPTSQ